MEYPAVILFDGVCNLCNGAVRFVIERDKKNYLHFAPIQSEVAKQLTGNKNIESSATFILVEDGKIYHRSTAALQVCRHLSGGWKLLYSLIIIPAFIRDAVYNFVAKNRYKWFGKKDTCMIPTSENKSKFLNDIL